MKRTLRSLASLYRKPNSPGNEAVRIFFNTFVTVFVFSTILSAAEPSPRKPYQAPLGQRIVQRTGEAAWHTLSGDWLPDFITGRDSSQASDDPGSHSLPFDAREQSRPGYRVQPTQRSIQYYNYIKRKEERGEAITTGELFTMQRMIANRSWPEAPEVTAEWQAVKDRAMDSPEAYGFWNAIWRTKDFQQTVASDQVWDTIIQSGRMDHDTAHTEASEKFRQYWHSLSEEERDALPVGRLTFNQFVRRGYDMRSDEQRERDEAYHRDQELQQKQQEAAARERELRRQEEERWRDQQEWFRQAWEREDRRIAQAAAEAEREQREQALETEVKDAPPEFRRIGQLDEDERQALLDCLCAASLGARPGVAQGYNLKIPSWADPLKHSCGSLGNGPCMASGWGCWRSFINFNSDEARNCLVDAGLDPEDPRSLQVLDQYNREHEEDLRVEIRVEPQEVCPGDEVRVSVVSSGGRGGYTYSYDAHSYLLQDNLPPRESKETSFTLTVDPGLKREQAPDGSWIYTRPLEAHTMAIRVAASSPTFTGRHNAQGRSDADGNMRVVQVTGATAYIKLRAHKDCVEVQQAAEDAAAGQPGVVIAPPVTPPRRPGRPPAARTPAPGTPDKAAQPPEKTKPAGRRPVRGGRPAADVPPTDMKAQPPDQTEPAKPVVPDQRTAGDPPTPPDQVSPPIASDDPEPAGDAPPKVADLPVFTDEQCAECLIIGGGMTAVASAGGDGSTVAQQKYYYVEGCAGQAVRITLIGSDGWTDSAESVDGRATVYRPVGAEQGVDEILVENLSMPGCELAWNSSFGGLAVAGGESQPSGAADAFDNLREAETTAAGPVSSGGTSAAMDVFSSSRTAATRHRHGDGLSTMQQQSQMEQAARAGDQTLREAAVVQSAGGTEAQLTRDETARAAARSQRESSLANVLGEAVASGVQTGAEAFGSTLGSEAATKASASIFERKRDRIPEAPPAAVPEKSAAPAATSAPRSSQPVVAAPAPTGQAVTEPAAETQAEPVKEASATAPASTTEVTSAPGCDFCSATDATKVTADGGSHMMCNTCKARWTCSSCGKITLEIGGATYTAYDSSGNAVWSGSISKACTACSDKWRQEQEARWGGQ